MLRLTIPALFLCSAVGVQAGKPMTTLFVDPDATGSSHNGSGWCNAFLTLQDALSSATSNTIIMVAEGVYRPDRGGDQSPGNRSATFHLQSRVTLLGGFSGCGDVNPNARDVILYETILSGDLSGDDGPGFSNDDENSYHVVTGSFVARPFSTGLPLRAETRTGRIRTSEAAVYSSMPGIRRFATAPFAKTGRCSGEP